MHEPERTTGSTTATTRYAARRERQIEFPREQAHNPMVTTVMLGLSLACIVIVVVVLLTDLDGPFIGPW